MPKIVHNEHECFIYGSGEDATLKEKTITTNGTYPAASDDADGYSQVTVNVNQATEEKSVTSNGTYTPSSGKIGFSKVTVNVNQATETKSITSNGTYKPSSGKIGFSQVTVNVNQATETKSITSNGTYKPSSGKIGFSSVSVNVPSWVSISGSFSWRTTAGYLVRANLSGYSYVILKCKSSGYNDNYKKDVYIGMPTNGTQVFGGWRCVHNTGYGDFYGNCWVRLHADSRGIYLDEFNNANEATGSYQALTYQALYGIR